MFQTTNQMSHWDFRGHTYTTWILMYLPSFDQKRHHCHHQHCVHWTKILSYRISAWNTTIKTPILDGLYANRFWHRLGGLLLGLPQNSSCLSSIGTCQILENRTLSKQTQQNHLLKNKNPSCGVDISVCVNNIASLYVGNQLYCKFMKAMVGHPKNIQSQAPRYSPSLVSLCLAIDLGKKGAPFINRLGFYGR